MSGRALLWLWLALASASAVTAAHMLRFEPLSHGGGPQQSTFVWDRWQQRVCLAIMGYRDVACTDDELKHITDHPAND